MRTGPSTDPASDDGGDVNRHPLAFLIPLAVSQTVTSVATAGWLSLSKTFKWLRPLQARTDFTAVSASSIGWSKKRRAENAVTYFTKSLFTEPSSGHKVLLVRYPAGEINPAHWHPVAHSMYVLQGSLVTHRGTFGRNTFVWFPPNEVMWHGASADEELVVLLLVGWNFSTHYVTQEPASVPGSAAT
jgi:quercetin dioxygenase-like cupin family protein